MYPFAGSFKVLFTEPLSPTSWNDQVTPWPWFIIVVARPGDFVQGANEGDGNRSFWCVYADENGCRTFHLQESGQAEAEISEGLTVLTRIRVEPQAPIIIPSAWDNLTEREFDYVLTNGKLER